LEIDVKLLLVQSTLDTVEGTIKSRIMSYVSSQIRTWGVQVKTPGDVASITIREAFIYAAALIEGVSDVLSVKIKKDNVYFPGQASWNTDRAEMEWIVENDVVINITT
jgi:hypothetical protein